MDKVFNPVEYHQEREKEKERFYEERKYLHLINDIIDKNIDSDGYVEPVGWTNKIDDMFSFLYNYADDIVPFDGEVVIKHNDTFVELFEMHGQGCYRSIKTIDEAPKEYVNFDDIVNLYEKGEKPYRSEVLEIVNRALETFSVAISGLNTDIVEIQEVKEYIRNNLK